MQMIKSCLYDKPKRLKQWPVLIIKSRVMKSLFHGSLLQYLASISGCFIVITSGINLAWTSPYLPTLLQPQSKIPTTSSDGAWCAIMPLLGAPVGAVGIALIVDKIGRKLSTLLLAPIVFFSFLAIAYATAIHVFFIARFAIGMVEGGLYTVLPMYIAEIADPKIRGFLTSIISVAAIIGTLFINVIGPYMSIFASSWISAIIPLVHFVTFMWMPESPYYLIKRSRFDQARCSLKLLRGQDDVEDELKTLCEAVKRQESSEAAHFADLFSVKSNRYAVIVYMILSVSNKFSGKNPLLSYTTIIFENAQGSVDPTLSVIIFSMVELLSTLVALNLIDKFGRRPLLIFSAAGCTLALLAESVYFFLREFSFAIADHLTWLPITGLISYNIIFSFGLAYGPVLLLGEMFPTNIKAIALSSGDTFSVLMGTLASQFFHVTMENLGMCVPFFSFSFCCAIGTYLIYKFLPETKGKTLEAIQMEFINKK